MVLLTGGHASTSISRWCHVHLPWHFDHCYCSPCWFASFTTCPANSGHGHQISERTSANFWCECFVVSLWLLTVQISYFSCFSLCCVLLLRQLNGHCPGSGLCTGAGGGQLSKIEAQAQAHAAAVCVSQSKYGTRAERSSNLHEHDIR